MNCQEYGKLTYYTFNSLDELGVIHGVFTRSGGISPQPWASLNTASTVGDSRENIIENRARIFQAVNRPVESIYDVWQVHSREVIFTRIPRPLDQAHIQADGVISDNPGITLMMRFADCVPVFLFHPQTGCAALVHAGWKGTVLKIVADAVRAMHANCGAVPAEIYAGIGPSIGPDHYEVGPEVIAAVNNSYPGNESAILRKVNDRFHFNLWMANSIALEEAGVRRIEVAEICTGCHTDEWFSHRAEGGKTGRFGAVLAPRKG